MGIKCDASRIKKIPKEADIDGNGKLDSELSDLFAKLMGSGVGDSGLSKWE